MENIDSGLLLCRLIVIITITIDIILIHRKKYLGKEIFTWKTKFSTEFIANHFKIGTFACAILLLMFIDEGTNDSYRYYKIILDISILTLLCILLLIPKRYIISDKGILIGGSFIEWTRILSFEKKKQIIILNQKKFGLLSKIEITVENVEKVEKIIEEKIKKKERSKIRAS